MFSLLWSLFLNMGDIGAFLSIAFAAQITDRIGRVPAIRLCLTMAVFGHTIQALGHIPHCWWLLFAGRLLIGASNGFFPICCATFISEISPLRSRGRMVVTIMIGFVLGSVFGNILGMDVVLGKAVIRESEVVEKFSI